MGFNKTALPAYVEQNGDRLLRQVMLGAESAKFMTLQTGVKNETALNIVSTKVKYQDGSKCGFTADGESVISQRKISAPTVKVNMSWCEMELLNTCLQHEVRVAAGQKKFPFEQDFIGDVVANINADTDRMVWQGDTAKTSDNVLKWTDGILKHLKASDGITVPAQKLTFKTLTPESVVKAVDDVVLAIPAAVLADSTIFMGYDMFRLYMVGMKNAKFPHYNADGIDTGETFYAGSNIRIKALPGLIGSNTIVAGPSKNLFYGCDMLGDDEKFDLWYSKDNQEFRLAVNFDLGTQVAFPNQMVISEYTPTV